MYMQTCCVCVPLRLGVMFNALLTFFVALVFVCNPGHWQYVFRHFAGGYTLQSQVLVGVVQITGLAAGLMGVLGIWYAKRQYVQGFLFWQVLRLAAWIWMFVIDVPLLEACEFWVNDIHRMTQEHGFNSLMYEIGMAGDCGYERQQFLILSILTLIVVVYSTWVTSRFTAFIDQTPKHLLRVPKDVASGAFYSQSTGERGYMNGTSQQDERMPIGHPVGGMMPPGAMPPPGSMGPMGPPGFGSMAPGMRLPI